ncbi:MAG: helix-turn-helix transcriptional regulator [Luteolibacter sp.]
MISAALGKFVRNQAVQRVYFAHAVSPPLDLAYLVNFPRISITLDGMDVMDLEQGGSLREMKVYAGGAVVIPPNCWNRPHWTGSATVLNILVGQKQLGLSLTSSTGDGATPPRGNKAVIPGAISGTERHLVQALLETERRRDAIAAPAILNALLHSLLDALLQPAPAATNKTAVAHEAIAIYLQQNFAFPLTRVGVADHFHLSPGHVSRLFRQEGLTGFNEYLNRVRIDRAKFLLRKHPLSLDEIAVKCGYSDTGYFCRVFKRLTKTTPTVYRNQE